MSRLSGFGLAAAALVMAVVTATASFAAPAPAAAPPIDPAQRAVGMKAAPQLITDAHLPCTLADARRIGEGTGPDKSPVTIYEIACKEGLGYVVAKEAKAGAPLVTYNCLMMAMPQANGKPNTMACQLPGNANPGLGLQTFVNQTGRTCAVDKGRFVGPTSDSSIYEVSCQGGAGLILTVPTAGGKPPEADNCLAYNQPGSIKCELTTSDQEIAPINAVAASSGKCAAVTNKRYVLSTTDGSDYFEVACGDGKGYMLHVDHTGKLAEAIGCAQAFEIGGGCTLTDARQAQTQQNAVYADLSKKAGFDCAVSKYALFPSTDPTKDVVEMACSNRPDGGVGIFPAHGQARVYDCLRSQDEGYKCSYTSVDTLYPKLSAELKAKNKGGCVVSSARPFAHADDGSDFVEVGCADGGPGWVLVYPAGSTSPSQLRNCTEVANLAGGCQLPTNKKKT
ncbi:MAG TPA: hypothetical protein VHZ26_18685 [Caulobacteraceae bacterium]|jgi:hypothetical protein|nr:hypothetical protein [Caulobacteraceae bacterium]